MIGSSKIAKNHQTQILAIFGYFWWSNQKIMFYRNDRAPKLVQQRLLVVQNSYWNKQKFKLLRFPTTERNIHAIFKKLIYICLNITLSNIHEIWHITFFPNSTFTCLTSTLWFAAETSKSFWSCSLSEFLKRFSKCLMLIFFQLFLLAFSKT